MEVKECLGVKSPPGSPLYAPLSGALHPRGSEKEQEGRGHMPQTLSYLRVPTSADHLVTIFQCNTLEPIRPCIKLKYVRENFQQSKTQIQGVVLATW